MIAAIKYLLKLGSVTLRVLTSLRNGRIINDGKIVRSE